MRERRRRQMDRCCGMPTPPILQPTIHTFCVQLLSQVWEGGSCVQATGHKGTEAQHQHLLPPIKLSHSCLTGEPGRGSVSRSASSQSPSSRRYCLHNALPPCPVSSHWSLSLFCVAKAGRWQVLLSLPRQNRPDQKNMPPRWGWGRAGTVPGLGQWEVWE